LLSDGKAGHLKQSKALLSIFKEGDFRVRSKVIEIKPDNKAARFFMKFAHFSAGSIV
jgi:hypothetical protein